MAHGGSDHNAAPRQLTLDDWADYLAASSRQRKSVQARAVPAESRGVVSSRLQSHPVETGKQAPSASTPALLTTHEAAALLHVHPRTVQRLVERGELEAVHLGAAVRFDPADVADLTARLKRREAARLPSCADTVKPSRAVGSSFTDRLRSQHA